MGPPANKKAKMARNNKKCRPIQLGQRGFLATCNYQQNSCIKEAYNILNEYANKLYPNSTDSKNYLKYGQGQDGDMEDISDALSREIQVTQNVNARSPRFEAVETGVNNLIFIRTTIGNPVELATTIVEDIKQNSLSKTRALIRLIPIEMVCSASHLDKILKAIEQIMTKYFKNSEESFTFNIEFITRYGCNGNLKRNAVIAAIAHLIYKKNPLHTVSLGSPQKTIFVEIIKGICMVSVVPNYLKYKKYNLIELGKGLTTAIKPAKPSETAITDSKPKEAEDASSVSTKLEDNGTENKNLETKVNQPDNEDEKKDVPQPKENSSEPAKPSETAITDSKPKVAEDASSVSTKLEDNGTENKNLETKVNLPDNEDEKKDVPQPKENSSDTV